MSCREGRADPEMRSAKHTTLCSPDWSHYHTTLRCTESVHFLWPLYRKFSGLLVRRWISSGIQSLQTWYLTLNCCCARVSRHKFTLIYTPPPAARGVGMFENNIPTPLLGLFKLLFAPKRRTKTNFIWSISGPLWSPRLLKQKVWFQIVVLHINKWTSG